MSFRSRYKGRRGPDAQRRRVVMSLVYCLGFLAVFTVLWHAIMILGGEGYWDSQFAGKNARLLKRLSEHPGKPLFLIAGTSRALAGLRPEVLMQGQGEKGPLVFNIAMGGADLLRQYIAIRRVVEEGVKPRWIGIEVMGVTLSRANSLFAEEDAMIMRARRGELDLLRSYSNRPDDIGKIWWGSRLMPTFQPRFGFKNPEHPKVNFFPMFWVLESEASPKEGGADDYGWRGRDMVSRAGHDWLMNYEHEYYADCFENYHVSEDVRRTLREMVDYCQKNGMKVFLYRTPESAEFRKFYPPGAREEVAQWLDGVTKEFGVPLYDCSEWMEEGYFIDGHHLNPHGTEIFSAKFREGVVKEVTKL